MTAFEDVRRLAAARTGGMIRMLLTAEGHLVDAEGAVEVGDAALAAMFGRRLVLQLLSVVSIVRGGELENRFYDPNFDWFAHVDPELASRALEIGVAPIADPDGPWDGQVWLAAVRELMDEVEAVLSLDEPLPRLRSADGMFAGLAVTRDWIELCGQLGVSVAALSKG
jgi:hypothetical protein